MTSARVSEVFTDWPPGPDDFENRQVNSACGIVGPPAMCTPSSCEWAFMFISVGGSSRDSIYESMVAHQFREFAMSDETFTCHYCQAVFDDAEALLAHFCPNAPTESDQS